MRVTSTTCILITTLLYLATTAVAQEGWALEFDGGDYVEVADPIELTGPLTLEAWVRIDVFDGGRIISNRNLANGYEFDVDSSGLLRLSFNGGWKADADISAHLGQWIHVAATWAGTIDGQIVLYVNGDPAAISSWNGVVETTSGPFRIGTMGTGNQPFTGAIDEVRVFSASVSVSTIRTWMNRYIGPDHPDYASLEGAWSFEEGTGQTAASAVGAPGRDGRLGADVTGDDADPTWVDSGMVPNRTMSLGGLKALYR